LYRERYFKKGVEVSRYGKLACNYQPGHQEPVETLKKRQAMLDVDKDTSHRKFPNTAAGQAVTVSGSNHFRTLFAIPAKAEHT